MNLTIKTLLSLALTVAFAATASAGNLKGKLSIETGAQSEVGSSVVGGSFSAFNGASIQASTANAVNQSYGATSPLGLSTSQSVGSATQVGGGFSLGNAATSNQGAASQAGTGFGQSKIVLKGKIGF